MGVLFSFDKSFNMHEITVSQNIYVVCLDKFNVNSLTHIFLAEMCLQNNSVRSAN